MTQILDLFVQIYRVLVSVGLAPLDIALVVVCAALYSKAEALDKRLHDCLEATDREAQNRIDSMK